MSDLVLRRLAAFLLALIAVGGLAASAAAGPAATSTEPYVPPADTIVHVEGDGPNGFGIEYYDGSWEFPPTISEVMAECEEYDRKVRQFRCKVSTRTWYRALAGFQETTDYYRSLP